MSRSDGRSGRVLVLDPLLSPAEAGDVVRLWHEFGSYGQYSNDGERWELRGRDGVEVVATFRTDELRYSVSWKGYCFADDAERRLWRDHTDDLSLDLIRDTFVADLDVDRPASGDDLGRLLVQRYIEVPS